jgi:hypothetical protein
MNPRPKAIKTLANYEIEIQFSNNEYRIFDIKPYLEFGIFSELNNTSYFNLARVENGTIVWPNEQDICPDTLYLESRSRHDDGAA